MAAATPSSERFRSATEFPKTVAPLARTEADSLYEEMRACLIFTNRSRAQLLRRNEEHKQSALKLRQDVQQLKALIGQLETDKRQQAQENQRIVTELVQQIGVMGDHLDNLTDAFDEIGGVEGAAQTQWSFIAMPGRFYKFLQAVKTIVLFWRQRDDRPEPQQVTGNRPAQLAGQTPGEDDRRDNPQMYEDPASTGRSLLDK